MLTYYFYYHITGAFVCNISSPTFDTIEISCELFGNLVRINTILTCTSCTSDFRSYAVMTDGPITISYLPAGNYTVDVIAVHSIYINITTTEMIVVANNNTNNMSTDEPTTESTTCKGKLMKWSQWICNRVYKNRPFWHIKFPIF